MITLYVDGYFTNVWDASVFVALVEKQLEFTISRALLREGQGVPPALREQAAVGRIPAMQHGDMWLTESLAIVEYLEDMFPAPGHPSVLPADPRQRARARQIMSWLRSDLWELRTERPWQMCVYPQGPMAPLSPAATRQAAELVALAGWLDARGELAEWNLAHTDLALSLLRLSSTAYPLTPAAERVLARNLERPSVRSYLDHARPKYPPPQPRS